MIILSSTQKLQIALSAVVTTNQLPFFASYVDVYAPDGYEPASQHGVSADAADVDVVSSPAASKKRSVKQLSVYNNDTVAAEVTVKVDDAGTDRILAKITLAVKSTLFYTDGEGFRVISGAGAVL